MNYVRKYGEAPFRVAVIHGGPGAVGEAAPVARRLSLKSGVLEPLQTERSIDDQVEGLRAVLMQNGARPVTLIGFSWGAWLSCILAARYPDMIKKIILVGSGPFEEEYADKIQTTRLGRLRTEEKQEIAELTQILSGPGASGKADAFARFGALYAKADTYKRLESASRESASVEYRFDVFESVWPEAAKMRRKGTLMAMAGQIRCPVTAIHGDFDPHPAYGVEKPLTGVLQNFRFILLKHCGHQPWVEAEASVLFYELLEKELHRQG